MTAEPAKTKLTPNPAFMSHISQHLFTAVLWVDDDLTITWLNAQAEQLLATSTGRLLGQSILALLAPEEVMASTSNDKDKSKRTIKSRFAQAKKNQQPFIDHDHLINTYVYRNLPLSIDYSVTPVIYEEEHCFIIEMWNKDRQSRISEEQRQQQQYSVARHMLRSVAHEIKNPLAGIRGAAQLLQRQFIKFNDASRTQGLDDTSLQKNAEKLRSYTDIIVSETDRLTHLVGQFLGSNQLPNWQMINIHEPLEHVLSLVVNQYPDVTVQRDYDLSLPELCADEDQLIQVFLNLINNACESMTEFEEALQQKSPQESTKPSSNATQGNNHNYQPTLNIQTRVVFQHTIASQQHKQVMQVTVTDNGSGIDPAMIGQIFFPMVTSRAVGTGLGLSIVQDIISRHHGMIDVGSTQPKDDSQERQTRFSLYLPFNQPSLEIKTK